MTKDEVILWMKKSANSLEVLNKTLSDKAKGGILPRSLTAILSGPLSPVEVEEAFSWLQHKDKLEPLKTHYEKLIASTKQYDQWTDPAMEMSTASMKLVKREFNNLRYLANVLINTLRATIQAIKDSGANGGATHLPEYRALNLANRTVTIGTDTKRINGEKVWEFLKDLCTAHRDDRIVPTFDGSVSNKEAVDQFRKLVGKVNRHKIVLSTKGGYVLNPEVKLLYGSQIAIRKTHKSRKHKANQSGS